MNKKILSLMLIMMSIFMTTAISSCSEEESVSGETLATKVLAKADSYLSNAYALDEDNTYYVVASSSSDAVSIVEDIIGQSWDGTSDKTINFGSNVGTVKVTAGSTDGEYAQIVINIRELDTLTLIICSSDYVNSDNRKWHP